MATVTREQKAIERLRTFARLRGIGGCRVISIGDACECVLCDLDAVAAALSAQPADGEAREHQERLYAMAVDDGETWDLSENDQAACNYGADCIGMLSAVISERDALAAQAPPASDPPGLASLTRSLCEALWDMQSSPDCWCPHDRAVTEPHTEACAAARAVNGAAKRFHLYNELPLPASDPPGLAALLKEPHFLGWPKTAAAGEYAYSRDAVMVSAAWYERLKALALPASPQAETKGDE